MDQWKLLHHLPHPVTVAGEKGETTGIDCGSQASGKGITLRSSSLRPPRNELDASMLLDMSIIRKRSLHYWNIVAAKSLLF